MTATPVAVTSVTKSFGEHVAVSDLSFELAPGTITGFLGPNGAGKTTTLRMIGGLLRPTRGQVALFGVDAREPRARVPLGYMPADPQFLPHLSGRDNLDLLAAIAGHRDVSARANALDVLALDDDALDRAVGGYSSGMRQKLAIVAAVQHRPSLVVLDEPANRLDPLAHRAFCDLIRAIAADGGTVLLSSHVLAEVEAVCDSVLLVRAGQLLTSAPVAELRNHAMRIVTIVYDRPPTRLPPQLARAHADGATVTGRVPADHPDQLRALLESDGVRDVTVVPASLEDVVLDLYTGAAS